MRQQLNCIIQQVKGAENSAFFVLLQDEAIRFSLLEKLLPQIGLDGTDLIYLPLKMRKRGFLLKKISINVVF